MEAVLFALVHMHCVDLVVGLERRLISRYASVDASLYEAILNRCVDSSKMCMNQMMAIDAAGGLGKGSIDGLSAKPWRNTQRTYVAALCTPNNLSGATPTARRLQP